MDLKKKVLFIWPSVYIHTIFAYFSVPDISAGGNIDAGSGYLQSPGYPDGYQNDLDNSITITAAEGMVCDANTLMYMLFIGCE